MPLQQREKVQVLLWRQGALKLGRGVEQVSNLLFASSRLARLS